MVVLLLADSHQSIGKIAEQFHMWGARLRGSHAAIDVLLPLMAVSFGLTAIGIVFMIVRASVLS